MYKVLVFLLGLIVGCVLTVAFLFILRKDSKKSNTDITWSSQQIPFEATKFKIFEVLPDGAIAISGNTESSHQTFTGPLVYIIAEGENQFYNDQIVEVPSGMEPVQVGTYRFYYKVVPVIKFIKL